MGSTDSEVTVEVTESPAMAEFETEVGETAGGSRSALRRHHAPALGAPGGRAARHHRRRLPDRARAAAEFYARLRQLFAERRPITTFGPYSPGQAVAMKRVGIEGIYLGGWATSAKGSRDEDPGPDLASYPLSQVPDEAAPIVRALLTADRNQRFARSRMTPEQRAATPEVDFRPFIIADADTGHGGDAHVRNLIRRFVEVGVPGYHIEDQKPGAKKCGHQGGKVLVGGGRADQAAQRGAVPARHHGRARHHRRPHRRRGGEPPRRLRGRARSAVHPGRDQRRPAELQGRVPGHPAEAPPARRRETERPPDVRDLATGSTPRPTPGSTRAGVLRMHSKRALSEFTSRPAAPIEDRCWTRSFDALLDAWQAEANLKTYPQAVADVIELPRRARARPSR